MSVVPGRVGGMCFRGHVLGPRAGPDGTVAQLNYQVEMWVPSGFPHRLPSVRELDRKVSRKFHTLADGALCLGSRLRLLSLAQREPTILEFFESVVVPYLYGHAYALEHGEMPWGELDHGPTGLLADYCDLLGFDDPEVCRRALILLGYRKRVANKRHCFCGNGVRLGRCHNRRLNGLRHFAPCRVFRAAVADLHDVPRE